MKRKRYTAEKIIAMLQEHEAGASVPELSRRHGIAQQAQAPASGVDARQCGS